MKIKSDRKFFKKYRIWTLDFGLENGPKIRVVRPTSAPLFYPKIIVDGVVHTGELWRYYWPAVLEGWTIAFEKGIVEKPTVKQTENIMKKFKREKILRNVFGSVVTDAVKITIKEGN